MHQGGLICIKKWGDYSKQHNPGVCPRLINRLKLNDGQYITVLGRVIIGRHVDGHNTVEDLSSDNIV